MYFSELYVIKTIFSMLSSRQTHMFSVSPHFVSYRIISYRIVSYRFGVHTRINYCKQFLWWNSCTHLACQQEWMLSPLDRLGYGSEARFTIKNNIKGKVSITDDIRTDIRNKIIISVLNWSINLNWNHCSNLGISDHLN
jgi:hypothetical protein